MRSAHEIINRNVLREIERIDAEERENGNTFDLNLLAARMAEFSGWKLDTVKKQLARYLSDAEDDEGSVWRINYLEAAARAVGRDVAWMIRPHEAPNTREATPPQVLVSALAVRLQPTEIRTLTRIFNRLLDHRPFYDLVLRVAELVLDGKNAAETALSAMDTIRESAAWDARPRNLRGRKISDKKS